MRRLQKMSRQVSRVVNEFSKIEDSFISRYLLREGESLDEAKERLKKEEQEIGIK